MKILLFATFALRCGATITNVQAVAPNATNCSSSSGTSCKVTVSSTTAGDAAGVCIHTSDNETPGAPSGWTLGTAGSTTSSCFYNLSLTGSITSFTFTVTSNDGVSIAYYEWSSSLGLGWTFDTGGGPTNDSAGTNPPTKALTLNNTDGHDVILQWARGNPICTGIASPYTNFTSGAALLTAMANSLNTASGSTVNWTNSSSSTQAVMAIALHETQTAAAATAIPTIL